MIFEHNLLHILVVLIDLKGIKKFIIVFYVVLMHLINLHVNILVVVLFFQLLMLLCYTFYTTIVYVNVGGVRLSFFRKKKDWFKRREVLAEKERGERSMSV